MDALCESPVNWHFWGEIGQENLSENCPGGTGRGSFLRLQICTVASPVADRDSIRDTCTGLIGSLGGSFSETLQNWIRVRIGPEPSRQLLVVHLGDFGTQAVSDGADTFDAIKRFRGGFTHHP